MNLARNQPPVPRPPGAPVASAPPTYEIGAIYRAHAQTVARWASRLGGPELGGDGIEDVVQEVFLTAHRLLPTFRGEAKITTWLFRITQNQVRHRRRKERFRRFLSGTAEDVAARLPARGPSPLEDLERRQATDTVYRVLSGMTDKYRTAFILFELEHLPGEEVATLLEQKLATIWVWLHRARAQFTAGLEKLEKQEQARARGEKLHTLSRPPLPPHAPGSGPGPMPVPGPGPLPPPAQPAPPSPQAAAAPSPAPSKGSAAGPRKPQALPSAPSAAPPTQREKK